MSATVVGVRLMKLRPGYLIVALLIGTAIPVFFVCIARQAAPFSLASEYTDSAIAASLAESLNSAVESHASVLYIRSELDYSLLPRLQSLYPSLHLLPWHERPEDQGCKNDDPEIIISGPCLRSDFYSVHDVWFPLWNTAILGVSDSGVTREMILFRIFGKWHVVSSRLYGV